MNPGSVLLLVLLGSLSLVVYRGSPALLGVSLAWSVLVALLHLMMERTGRISAWRGLFFTGLAVFFLLDMHLTGPGRTFTPICHVGLAGNLVQTAYSQYLSAANGAWSRYGALSVGIFWILAVLALGGGFCSWVCFFGGVDDACSRALVRPPVRLPGGTRWRVFQLASLVFFSVMAFYAMEPVFCRIACPFKEPGEVLDACHNARALGWFSVLAIGLPFVVVLPLLTGKRTFCSSVCPFGAIPPLLHRLNPYRVTAGKGCTGCGTCETVCPSFAIERDGDAFRANRYCTLCMRCVDSCPTGVLKPTLFHRRESRLLPFVAMAFSGALSVFYVPGGVLALLRAVGLFPG
jgi:ferredoxin